MKSTIKSVLLSVALFTTFYLLGSFYSASFDISTWTQVIRGVVSFFGGVIAIFGGIIYKFSITKF